MRGARARTASRGDDDEQAVIIPHYAYRHESQMTKDDNMRGQFATVKKLTAT
jgi:hypothetical protein